MGKSLKVSISVLLAFCLWFGVGTAGADPKGGSKGKSLVKKVTDNLKLGKDSKGPKSGDGNNGHGNDPRGVDPSNPSNGGSKKPKGSGKGGSKKSEGGDGNNGHGNDPGGIDPSNPGNGGKPSVNDLVDNILGLGGSNSLPITPPNAPPILPEPINDPFAGLDGSSAPTPPIPPTNTGVGSTDSTGPAYGSIPLITNDASSVNYVLSLLVSDAQKQVLAAGGDPQTTAEMEKIYIDYARKLTKTLSQLTQKQQNLIFYGRE